MSVKKKKHGTGEKDPCFFFVMKKEVLVLLYQRFHWSWQNFMFKSL